MVMRVSDFSRYLLMVYLVWETVETPSYVLMDPILTFYAVVYKLVYLVALIGLYRRRRFGVLIAVLDAVLSFFTVIFYIISGAAPFYSILEPVIYFVVGYYTYGYMKR